MWKYLILSLILLNILLSCYLLVNNNLIINFDLSRDLMIWWDIIANKNLILIGGHSGTIPGIFHGPLWYYFNLPAFILGDGNPLILGWFWIFLSIITLVIIYTVGSKLFDNRIGLLSTLVFSASSIISFADESKYFYNPYGAVMLFPVFFYLFLKYLQTLNPKILIVCLFILGLIIQFQMAFGVPILILSTLLLGGLICYKKKLQHLLSFLVLLLPLSTYILFELKNNFLQTKIVLEFMLNKSPSRVNNLTDFIQSRFNSLALDNFRMLVPDNLVVQIFISIVFFLLLSKVLIQKDRLKNKQSFLLFSFLYFGFFIITFLFWGQIVNYYWPFLAVQVILFCGLLKGLSNKITLAILSILLVVNWSNSFKTISSYDSNISNQGFNSWNYNYQMARIIFEDANKNPVDEFGYYIFTPNFFGYSQRYAMEYVAKQYPKKKALPFQKKRLTYLIIINPPKDRPDLNTDHWTKTQVKITSQPIKNLIYKDYKIEKYLLTGDEINNPSDRSLFLLNNLHFR